MQSVVSPPIFAPMNSTTAHRLVPRNRHRKLAFTVSLSLLLSLNLAPGLAQSRNQKRITSVWTATNAAGSVVHVVSDSAVNDYEAYTRGGRFYVKIPAADLPSARGSLLGRGFDDVQIQRYGDGIIISFHLLPGSSARVQQANNRLEIIFTALGSTAARPSATDESTRTRTRRVSDSAGPSPDSAVGSRPSRAPNATRGGSRREDSSFAGNDGATSSTGKRSGVEGYTDRGSPRNSETPKPTPSGAVAVASPQASPSPVASPAPNTNVGSSTASPGSAATSSFSPTPIQQPSLEATPVVESTSNDSDWRSRLNYWKVWAQLNWVPLLIGGVVFLALLVFLFFRRSSKRISAANEGSARPAAVSSEPVTPKAVPAAAANKVAPQSDLATAAAASQTRTTPTQSSVTSSAEPQGQPEVDPDREVFEL
jgi:hypothetical protein